jgi:hypothetical protein
MKVYLYAFLLIVSASCKKADENTASLPPPVQQLETTSDSVPTSASNNSGGQRAPSDESRSASAKNISTESKKADAKVQSGNSPSKTKREGSQLKTKSDSSQPASSEDSNSKAKLSPEVVPPLKSDSPQETLPPAEAVKQDKPVLTPNAVSVVKLQVDDKKELKHLEDEFDLQDFDLKRKFSPTIYHTPILFMKENTCKAEDRVPMRVYTGEGSQNLSVCKEKIYDECVRQGACIVGYQACNGSECRNHTYYLNYKKGPAQQAKFKVYDFKNCPLGLGSNPQVCLDSFYSVAADARLLKVGSVIYVPAVRGLRLPDGSSHNGFFVVRDRGGAIKDRGATARFDFFIGTDSWQNTRNPLVRLRFSDQKTKFSFYIVRGATAELIRVQRNYPEMPEVKRTSTFQRINTVLKKMKEAVEKNSVQTSDKEASDSALEKKPSDDKPAASTASPQAAVPFKAK